MMHALQIAAMFAPLLLAGGGREVSVRFVNQTYDIRTLYVTTPAGRQLVGAFSHGGSLTVTIPVDSDAEVDVHWVAGNQSGRFTLTADTGSYLRIDLTARGPAGPYEVKARSFISPRRTITMSAGQ